jgi:RNAse (barnase) inhibitor barstar
MRYVCPVCGFPDLHELPHSDEGGGSYEICPSCGFQFGVSDEDRGFSYDQWRQEWIANGTPWRSVGKALSRELKFPAYFGNNWDALSDCLRDLSWIKPHRVILLHEDSPPLEAKDVVTYLDVLSECVRDWKSGENHELVVVFPREVPDALAGVAK